MAKERNVVLDHGRQTVEVHYDQSKRIEPAVFFLTEMEGKAVQEILKRYVTEELLRSKDTLLSIDEDTYQLDKDIDYITGLAKLFD